MLERKDRRNTLIEASVKLDDQSGSSRNLSQNLIVFVAAQMWRGCILLAFVPAYIKILGVESYGLVGILSTLQAWLVLLDFGLRPTMVREMARYTGGGCDDAFILQLYRTIEICAFCIAVLVFLILLLGSGWLASHWIMSENLSTATVVSAFAVMGLVAAAQLMESVYVSTLIGLQKQILHNFIVTVAVTVRAVGALVIIYFISPTITAFFLWQGLVSIGSLLVLKIMVQRTLPRSPVRLPRFHVPALVHIRKYAGGMVGLAVLSLVITQSDKILLSSRVPLAEYGYYVLAASVAAALSMITTPIGNTFLPRLTELVENGDRIGLSHTFHQLAQLISVFIGTPAVIMMVFADRLLFLWTGDPTIVSSASDIMRIMAMATALYAVASVPYLLQIAHGRTGLALRVNSVAAIIFIPTLVVLAHFFGALGAATALVIGNACVLIGNGVATFKEFLHADRAAWAIRDTCIPLTVIAIAALLAAPFLGSGDQNRIHGMLALIGIAGVTLSAALMSAPLVRRFVADLVNPLVIRLRRRGTAS